MASKIKYDSILDKLREKDLGEQTLSDVLSLGNKTEGNDILLSAGDIISAVSGANLTLQSGLNGGDINISASSSINPSFSSNITIYAGDHTSTGEGGDITLLPGGSISGEGGTLYLNSGNSNNNIPGDIVIQTGTNGTISGDIYISGENLLLQGLLWPDTDGSNGYVLTTNGAGSLSFQPVSSAVSAPPLSSVLSIGNQTAGFDILLQDSLILSGNAQIIGEENGAPGSINGADILITGGPSTTSSGDGGDVIINGGSSLSGDLGNIILNNLVWPQSDGLSGQQITTDGVGNLFFQDPVIQAKGNITIPTTNTDIVDILPLDTTNTAKWLVTAYNSTSNEISVFEVLGAQVNNIPKHSVANKVFNDVKVVVDVQVVGLEFRLVLTNNDPDSIDISYIRIA